ncbi:MAG: hypothetical protein ACXVCN_13020 [Bdellovibrio sp.]
MKKVVVVTYEGIYSLPLVEALLNNKNIEVVKILKSGTIYAEKTGIEGILFLLKKSSLFFLVPKFFENILFIFYKIFIPVNRRPFKTLTELGMKYGVPVETVGDINKYPHEQYRGFTLFSSYFNQIFSKKTLSHYGDAYNIHPAPIPVGRGLFCQFWLLLNPYQGEKYYQTIHRVTDKIDAGEVVKQESVHINTAKQSMADYMNKVTVLGIDMMLNFDFQTQANVHQPVSASYYSFPRARDVLRFWWRGLRFMRVSDVKNYFKIKVIK